MHSEALFNSQLYARFLPEIVDHTERIANVAILTFAAPTYDLAPMGQKLFSGGFEINDK